MKAPFIRIGISVTASLFALSALSALSGCAGGTGEGNPEFGYISVSLRAQVDEPAAKQAANDTLRLFDEDNTPYTLHNIYAHVDRIEIARPQGSECRPTDSTDCTDSSVVVSGSRFVDLLENPSLSIVNNLPVPVGTYSRMKVRFGKLADTWQSVPDAYRPLIGHSIVMKGSFAYGGVSNRPLAIHLDLDEAFVFEQAAGLAVRTASPYSWAGVFLAGKWLKELKIKECLDDGEITLQPDGGLVIESGSECNEIEDSLEKNVRRSTWFHEEDGRKHQHD